jgi:glycosyltransferase involved in cell wall biosynthesis
MSSGSVEVAGGRFTPGSVTGVRPQLLSVVMAVRNEAAHLDEQLAALAAQEYEGAWEVVVADNGSTDDTRARAQAWTERLRLRIVDASARRGPGAARNDGVAAAAGDALAFCDGDDIVAPGWLAAHAHALDEADLVAGAIAFFDERRELGLPPVPTRAPTLLGWLPYAGGGNASVWRTAFEGVGGFPERNPCGEDVEFSWLVQLAGLTFAYQPAAVVHRRTRSGTRAQLRQAYRYGKCDVDLYARYRDRGATRAAPASLTRTYLGLVARLPGLGSPEIRGRWATQAGRRAGRIVASARARVLLP